MKKVQRASWEWLFAGIVVGLVGCAEQAKSVSTEMVEGVVTLDGKPVPGATVTFQPVADKVGASATGMTDETGKYTLTAVGAGSGAQRGAGTLPGEYYVGVVKVELPPPPKSEEELPTKPKEAEMTYVVPQKYSDPTKSDIKKTVKPGKNEINIELTSQ